MAARADTHELTPLVAEVLQSLENAAGRVSLPAAALAAFEPRFRAVPAGAREQTLIDVVAAAVKLKRLGGEAATDAILALCELAFVLEGRERAEAAFGAQGLPSRTQRDAIGGQKLSAPAAEDKPRVAAAKPKRGLR
jgi:hypothetical protein